LALVIDHLRNRRKPADRGNIAMFSLYINWLAALPFMCWPTGLIVRMPNYFLLLLPEDGIITYLQAYPPEEYISYSSIA
jgi:hypothetical protein